jgi:hypothetical protein
MEEREVKRKKWKEKGTNGGVLNIIKLCFI